MTSYLSDSLKKYFSDVPNTGFSQQEKGWIAARAGISKIGFALQNCQVAPFHHHSLLNMGTTFPGIGNASISTGRMLAIVYSLLSALS